MSNKSSNELQCDESRRLPADKCKAATDTPKPRVVNGLRENAAVQIKIVLKGPPNKKLTKKFLLQRTGSFWSGGFSTTTLLSNCLRENHPSQREKLARS